MWNFQDVHRIPEVAFISPWRKATKVGVYAKILYMLRKNHAHMMLLRSKSMRTWAGKWERYEHEECDNLH